jgi:4-hydroxyphenylpyruvate dioxygenase-like putative hemolysin
MEEMRRRPHAGTGNDSILNHFQFIEICCDVTKTDLTDFFEQWGFFYVGEIEVMDYQRYQFNVTQEIVDEVKEKIAAKKYPKPTTDITREES